MRQCRTRRRFNPHNVFTYLRNYGNELIVVAVNFSYNAFDCKINIPQHAFDILGLIPGEYMATELISGKRSKKTLSPVTPFEASLGSNSAVIWKVRMQKKNNAERKPAKKLKLKNNLLNINNYFCKK